MRARAQQRGKHGVAETVERNLVAEEERFVDRHRLGDFRLERLRIRLPQAPDEIGDRSAAGAARHRHQAAFDQILFFRRENQAGALAQEFAQIFVIERRHEQSPLTRRTTLDAISSSGSTAEHCPLCAAEPGMPHTTLDASSCAMTLPPPAAMSRAPSVPSVPMPVSTTASSAGPKAVAAE